MSALLPLATRVSMRNVRVVDDVCRSAFGCGGIHLATVAVFVVTTVLALLVIATVFHTTDAGRLLEDELERLAAERDAFSRFRSRVEQIEAREAPAAVRATGGIAAGSGGIPDDTLDRVREAYRHTVMAVDHYDVDYGEPLADNVAAEFGEDVAAAVVDGTQLTPQLKAALLRSSEEAAKRRDSLRSTLQTEATSLSEARAALRDIQTELDAVEARLDPGRSFDALAADWRELSTIADRCRGLLVDRQDTLHHLAASMPPGQPEIQAYLYADLPVDHPVLADATGLAEAVTSLRRRVLLALTRRV